VVWTGAKNAKGYGRCKINGRSGMVHRIAYESLAGAIPDGLVLDHLCRVRACVAVDHLKPVTDRENILRGEGVAAIHALKTHCPQGHPYDESNTHIDSNGERRCRTCLKRQRSTCKEATPMAEQPTTNTTARPVPEWVHDIVRASALTDEYLMPAERALLDAVVLLIRARSGRTRLPEPKRVAQLFISDALTALDAKQGRAGVSGQDDVARAVGVMRELEQTNPGLCAAILADLLAAEAAQA
jgi:hypothetical protein